MTLGDWTTVFLGMAGAAFFLPGTVGILRFPDFNSRSHAITKADTLGLGLIVTGLLPAIYLSVQGTGSTRLDEVGFGLAGLENRDTILLLGLVGFGVKAGAVPLYFWLPLAHPVAPAPASAVLSGCMIKAGLLGWPRFSPLGTVPFSGWSTLVIVAG